MRYLFSMSTDQPDIVQHLIESDENGIHQRTVLGSSLLHISVLEERLLTTSTLILSGCDTNDRNDFDETPLHWVAKTGFVSVCSLLLAHGGSPNAEDSDGNTPFHWATEYDQIGIMEVLLAHGANPNIENLDGETALDIAAKCGNLRATQLLLNAPGINYNHINSINDATIMDHANFGENLEVQKLLGQLSIGCDRTAENQC